MNMIPALETQRLILDAFTFDDCPRVELLAGDEAVARTTLQIPHPYPAGSSRTWISTHAACYSDGEGVTFAIRLKDRSLIGCVSLGVCSQHERAELGYWLGVEYWNHGYMTEAAGACVDFG